MGGVQYDFLLVSWTLAMRIVNWSLSATRAPNLMSFREACVDRNTEQRHGILFIVKVQRFPLR